MDRMITKKVEKKVGKKVGKNRGKAQWEGDSVQISMRFPLDTIEGVDEWVDEIRASGQIGTRSIIRVDVIREVVARAIEARRAAKAGKLSDEGKGKE
jgi:hypothetical protein